MTGARFDEIFEKIQQLRIGVVGDFSLDRYLEIDPNRKEISIETELPVHNVIRVRGQPGSSGTALANLRALGVGTIYPVGFAGFDGEGYELTRALAAMPEVEMGAFLQTEERSTFTYTKPLLMHADQAPEELSRLDIKNWSATSEELQTSLAQAVERLAVEVDGWITLSQVDVAGTGVVGAPVLAALGRIRETRPNQPILADSRLGLAGFPPVIFKLNRAEFCGMCGLPIDAGRDALAKAIVALATRHRERVFVTLAEEGILGCDAEGFVVWVPALPPPEEMDVVGAGDSVSASLVSALAAGATMEESMRLARASANEVIRQLGTTGTPDVERLRGILCGN